RRHTRSKRDWSSDVCSSDLQVVNDKLPLQKLLGGTSYSAVFQAQSPNPQAKNIAIKFIRSGANADSQASLLYRASKLSHPNLLGLMPGGPCQLAGMDLVYLVMKYAEEDLGGVLRGHPQIGRAHV